MLAVLSLCCAQANADNVQGPYPIYAVKDVPNGYARVVIDSSDMLVGGYVWFTNVESGSTIQLQGSSTYVKTWYYFVPEGTYRLDNKGTNQVLRQINGTSYPEIGDEFKFTHSSGGFISFGPFED